MGDKTLGQLAYEAYNEEIACEDWNKLSDRDRNDWERAADAVRMKANGAATLDLGASEDDKSYAQVNFEAYARAVGGQTYDKKPIPAWDDLTQAVRDGWAAGAGAVIEGYDPDNELGWGDDSDAEIDYDLEVDDDSDSNPFEF